MTGTMLIGYDVEWWGESPITPDFLSEVRRIHNQLGIPATLFVVGKTLERWLPAFQEIATDPLFDVQQHTYSHQLLKTVYIDDGTSIRVQRGIGLDEIRREVRRTSELLRDFLGVDCVGLTGPWCYYRGLRDRPDILAVLKDEGIRFTRTDGRNEHDWHPVSMDLQPYWYEHTGFPDILEVPVHGWHDSTIRDEILGWSDLDGYTQSVTPYIERAAAEDKVFSYLQHDWTSIREDLHMRATERLLRYGQELGLTFAGYLQFYRSAASGRARSGLSSA